MQDEKNFPNPLDFDPGHFDSDTFFVPNFLGFGQGPRACLGQRFALLEAKVAVISVWRKYSFTPGTKTIEPLVLDKNSALSWVKGGLWAKVVERDQ